MRLAQRSPSEYECDSASCALIEGWGSGHVRLHHTTAFKTRPTSAVVRTRHDCSLSDARPNCTVARMMCARIVV